MDTCSRMIRPMSQKAISSARKYATSANSWPITCTIHRVARCMYERPTPTHATCVRRRYHHHNQHRLLYAAALWRAASRAKKARRAPRGTARSILHGDKMTTYAIEPERATLHGTFSREYPPVLTIDSGDTVRFRTLDAGWHLEPFTTTEEDEACKFGPRLKERDYGHALCGPVAIRGAQPGMTLEVQINEVRPGTWGWTIGGCMQSELNKRL